MKKNMIYELKKMAKNSHHLYNSFDGYKLPTLAHWFVIPERNAYICLH